jgi:hypothetical protein
MAVTKELLRVNKPGHAADKYMVMRSDTKQLVYAQPPTGWLTCPLVGVGTSGWQWWMGDDIYSYGPPMQYIERVGDAVSSAYNSLRTATGWFEPDSYSGVAQYLAGQRMYPFADVKPGGTTPLDRDSYLGNFCSIYTGYLDFQRPSVMGTYTQARIKLYASWSLVETLYYAGGFSGISRMDTAFSGIQMGLRVMAIGWNGPLATVAQSLQQSVSGYPTTTILANTLNNAAASVAGGENYGVMQYDPTTVQYYHQTAPRYATAGWTAPISLPAAFAAQANDPGVTLYFSWLFNFPASSGDIPAMVCNYLGNASLEVYST